MGYRIAFLAFHLVLSLFNLAAAAPEPAPGEALVWVNTRELSAPVPREITGKFCEHLGANIYNGMDAQILRNPTFADFPFWTGEMTPDGLTSFQFERGKIEADLRRQALRAGWPETDLADLMASRNEGLASFWSRFGPANSFQPSPDTGPHGGRAQRLELKAGGGLKQWFWLPLHRVRDYRLEVFARSPNLSSLKVGLLRKQAEKPCAEGALTGLDSAWHKVEISLSVPTDADPDAPYCLILSSDTPGQLVLGHAFLRPADHVNGADPDVIRKLKEAKLPLLRWPGGNFVSAYHWEDGVGPVETRPTKPNFAWGGVEPNTFGTDEFVAFCRAVGCEPMICINAGTGTPEEAARWVEYCNGPASSPMGARRAANGHSEPYQIHRWEAGNELWGRWQANWTTASGYVDRYKQFRQALLKSDPSIEVQACGAPAMWGKDWNDTLIAGAASEITTITDHPLIGGNVVRSTEPLDVFRDFMLVPDLLAQKWRALRNGMMTAGIKNPRLAVTELQMFAHLGAKPEGNEPERLRGDNLVNPGTLAEALYDTLIYHRAAGLQPFVELVTHSATVNHGGGLRKERERVYANPCHYANLMFAEFANARPVRCGLRASSERAPLVLPDIKNSGLNGPFSAVDPLAAMAPNGQLIVSLVNRGTTGAIRVTVTAEQFEPAAVAEVSTLTGSEPWAANTLEAPEKIRPVHSQAEVHQRSLVLDLPPFSIVQAKVSPRQ